MTDTRATRAIRSLFLAPQSGYSTTDAAALLGMDRRTVRDWFESGEIEAVDTSHGVMLPWSEVVAIAIETWSQETIEEALGDDLARAIPELLRLADLHVRIPRFELLALEHLAARESSSIDTFLTGEFLGLVSAHSDWLGTIIPGFAEALAWPEGS
jgi:hypothetical protein